MCIEVSRFLIGAFAFSLAFGMIVMMKRRKRDVRLVLFEY